MKNIMKNIGRNLVPLAIVGAIGVGVTYPIAFNTGYNQGRESEGESVRREVETAMEDLRSRGENSYGHIDTAKKVEIKPVYGTNSWDSVNIKGIEISQKGVKVIRGSNVWDVEPTKIYGEGTPQFKILRPLLTVEAD